MRKPARLGIAAMVGAAWGIQAWSAACPQDCDEADKVDGCCPQAAPVAKPPPPPPAQTTSPPPPKPKAKALPPARATPAEPAPAAERTPAAALEARELGGVRMVRVPAGTFQMGSADGDEEAGNDEKPQHTVTISQDFYLMETEVTQALWQKVMNSAPWDQEDRRAYKGVSLMSPSYPAIYVSWCDAVLFANALSARDGLTKAYSYPASFVVGMKRDTCNALANEVKWNLSADGYRLPTEAEWEYAAREGAKGSWYAGTSEPAEVCRFGNIADPTAKAKFGWGWDAFSCEDGHLALAPVGSFAASGWGLNDMTGNVWEWVFDTYDSQAHSKSARVDPTFYDGDSRVIRGGSWGDDPRLARAAYRDYGSPGGRGNNLGLRLPRYARAADRFVRTPGVRWSYLGLRLARSTVAPSQ